MKRILILLALAACGSDPPKLSVEKLQDPATCQECHATHYTQWSGSMHAFASDDPVFVAMNKRGQRDTAGKLGTFCVKCHAPMAVELGLTDGTNFDPAALPPEARGVTCYFCHSVADVTDTHNNPLVLADDQTMRGGISKPVESSAHFAAGDPLLDSSSAENGSKMCGSCHDITVPEELNGVPGGVAVERTFAEWQTSIFATDPSPGVQLTCGECHMPSSDDVVADAPGLDVPVRRNGFHSHQFPAIDLATTPFPEMEAQRAAVQMILDPSVGIIGTAPAASTHPTGGICVSQNNGGEVTVRIDNLGSGHAWPSGAAQDRRTWLEVIGYDAANTVLFQSGVVPDGTDPEAAGDPTILTLFDRDTKADGTTPAHFFYDVANVQSNLLKVPVTLDPNDPRYDHSITKTIPFGQPGLIDHITARVLVRPFPYAALHELVDGGDLDPAFLAKVPTFVVAGALKEWHVETALDRTGCNPYP